MDLFRGLNNRDPTVQYALVLVEVVLLVEALAILHPSLENFPVGPWLPVPNAKDPGVRVFLLLLPASMATPIWPLALVLILWFLPRSET